MVSKDKSIKRPSSGPKHGKKESGSAPPAGVVSFEKKRETKFEKKKGGKFEGGHRDKREGKSEDKNFNGKRVHKSDGSKSKRDAPKQEAP